MSEATGMEFPGARVSLYDHVLALCEATPDAPLPRDGEPYPDDGAHGLRHRPKVPRDRRRIGLDVASVLDAHLASTADPDSLAEAFHELYVPIQENEHIAAAARRADRDRVLRTGRWLLRHGTDRCAVTVGLALLATVGTPDDIPLIQTIGLLSDHFGPLAARALERLPEGGTEALLRLADRVTGWGRVYVVEALCRLDDPAVWLWLLRRSCDGDCLNAYFAGRVAETTRLHDVMSEPRVEGAIADNTGALLLVLAYGQGMGMTLSRYRHAETVLAGYLRHVERLGPSVRRYSTVGWLADSLGEQGDAGSIGPVERWAVHRNRCLALLGREDWRKVARKAL
ncbi:hypothetical protein ACWCPD_32880 [Streptomyces sp. NPDC001935]